MTVIAPRDGSWLADAPVPVGPPETLLDRLCARAGGTAVALGIDCPIGLPRAYVALHLEAGGNFPSFVKTLAIDSPFFDVAGTLADVSAARPFYPARAMAGMTRLSHARALGLADAGALCRACDLATAQRPAGAPLFWTLGANQSGKAAIAAWRELIIPALHAPRPARLWPFDGTLRVLLEAGAMVMAETYPADAMAQLGVRRAGSKRRQADRVAYAAPLRASLSRLGVSAAPPLEDALACGFGADAAGEDRLDSLFGALCVLSVVKGQRDDHVPSDPWIASWEGWVLGQAPDSSGGRSPPSGDQHEASRWWTGGLMDHPPRR
jgi:hypothetical protein